MIFQSKDINVMLAQAIDETHREAIQMDFAIRRWHLITKEWVAQWEPAPCPSWFQ